MVSCDSIRVYPYLSAKLAKPKQRHRALRFLLLARSPMVLWALEKCPEIDTGA